MWALNFFIRSPANHFLVFHVAPTDRAASVGNVVRSPKRIMGIEVPSFLAKALNMDNEDGEHYEVGNIVDEMDEECYMGKDGEFDDCVDFDPLP